LIAHADPLARAYVRGIAENHLQLVDTVEAENFEALLARLRNEPEIVLLVVDLDLLGKSWEIALRYLGTEHPGVRVAAFSGSLGHEDLSYTSISGNMALIPKQLPEAALVETLGQILAGADSAHPHADGDPVPAEHKTDGQLTRRQRDVIRLLSEGRSNREISEILGIAEGTVKVHVNAAFRILGVHNRVGASVAFRENFGTS
jgi:DNA-binding NarL/FixJ family response regulator